MNGSKVYQIITDKIIKHLEEGSIPWKKSWIGKYPTNLVSKKHYQGINFFLLDIHLL